jgi:protein-S-isoprenylcysteine O-methyltransferase Ste14
MSTIIREELGDSIEAPVGERSAPRLRKSALERNRKWIHLSAWPALLLTVLTTQSTFHDPGVRLLLALFSYVLVTVGTVGRLWCGLYLFGRKSKKVCQDGPYSLCRNPLYASALLNIAGLSLASNRVSLMIALPALLGAYYFLVIAAEERRLRVLFGREYEAYYARTPRFIPRFGSYRMRETVVLDPAHYLRGIVKAMGYFWLLLLLQLVQNP